jgi:predicted nucleic acid-binding protein
MTTFIDTSALLSAINQGEKYHQWSVDQIAARRAEGPLVIADIVYSELSAGMASREDTDAAIAAWALERLRSSDDALFKAGQAYKAYRKKKRGPGEPVKTNVLPDFLIGALAEAEGAPLVTTNQDDFLRYFPGLDVIHPPGDEPAPNTA